MSRQNAERWVQKHDKLAYGYWVDVLKPVLGRSVKRTEEAIRLLRGQGPFADIKEVRAARDKISKAMIGWAGGACISGTYHSLLKLSREHKRKILKQRAAR